MAEITRTVAGVGVGLGSVNAVVGDCQPEASRRHAIHSEPTANEAGWLNLQASSAAVWHFPLPCLCWRVAPRQPTGCASTRRRLSALTTPIICGARSPCGSSWQLTRRVWRGNWTTATAPLAEQLSRLGIRQIELDCFADPQGRSLCRPARPQSWRRRSACRPVPNHDPEHRLRAPGFKVMHVQDMDYFSSVLTLKEGLQQVRAWSDQHPRHFPIFILLELKEDQSDPGN